MSAAIAETAPKDESAKTAKKGTPLSPEEKAKLEESLKKLSAEMEKLQKSLPSAEELKKLKTNLGTMETGMINMSASLAGYAAAMQDHCKDLSWKKEVDTIRANFNKEQMPQFEKEFQKSFNMTKADIKKCGFDCANLQSAKSTKTEVCKKTEPLPAK